MCENYDLYLRSMSKEEFIEYFYFVTNNYRNLFDKSTLENIKLEKQVNCLKQEMEEKNTYEEKLNSMIDNLRDDISDQKIEIERLKKELANERNAVITFQESANAHRLKVGEVMKQNAELQKQVDELETATNHKVKELAQHLYDMKDLYWDENEVNPMLEIRLDPQKFKRICKYYFGVEVE